MSSQRRMRRWTDSEHTLPPICTIWNNIDFNTINDLRTEIRCPGECGRLHPIYEFLEGQAGQDTSLEQAKHCIVCVVRAAGWECLTRGVDPSTVRRNCLERLERWRSSLRERRMLAIDDGAMAELKKRGPYSLR